MEAFELAEIKELTQLCFASNAYLNNFPQVFKPQNSEYFFLLRDKNKLVCFCTIYPTYFSIKNLYLKGYCIGSVCTHPSYRGRGLASQILSQAQLQAQKFQGDFIYLFSEKNKLYEKFGFQLFGNTFIGVPNAHLSKIKKLSSDYNINCYEGSQLQDENKISKIWSFLVQNSSPVESILSYLEFKDILQIRNLKIYVLSHQQKYCSVCFLNKGDDFQNVLHGIYYTHRDYATMLVAEVFQKLKNSTLHFFPGVFATDFVEFFNYGEVPAMYLKVLQNSQILSAQSFAQVFARDFARDFAQVFVRSLQGT